LYVILADTFQSYGGHYGPEFAYYLEQQNVAIDKGTVQGEKINLVALGINNGWTDPIISYKAYLDFSVNNTYNDIITKSEYNSYLSKYNSECVPALNKCASSGTNSACEAAENTCYNEIEGPISESGDFDVYDIREPSNDPYPPETYATYLTNSAVVKAIGAKSTYTECSNSAGKKFTSTGDGKYFLSHACKQLLTTTRLSKFAFCTFQCCPIRYPGPDVGRRRRLDLQLDW
jgi:carboxypeptidase C (cathepsin A)